MKTFPAHHTSVRIPRQRRGSLYASVVMVGSLISMLGLSAMLVSRVNRVAHDGLADATIARLNAQAALRLGMLAIENDPNWRFSNDSDQWFTDTPLGKGTCSLTVTDPSDNDLSDAAADPVVLTGTGRSGSAVHRTEVTLAPLYRGYDCLQSAIHSGDDVFFNGTMASVDHTVSANDDIFANNSMVFASLEAAGNISGGDFDGTVDEDAETRELPAESDVLSFYLEHGTEIDASDLPTQFHSLTVNSGFETGVVPWVAAGCTIARNTNRKYAGDASLLVSNRAETISGVSHDVTNLLLSGRTYRVTFAIRQITLLEPVYVHLQVQSMSSSDDFVAGPFTPSSLNSWRTGSLTVQPSWSEELVSATLTISTSSTSPEYAGMESGFEGSPTPGDFYLDEVTLRETASVRNIEHVLLSPESNPFGETNARGIYFIDLQGSRIVVRDCRIFGTLILIDPSDSSEIGDHGGILMQPAVPDFPALIVTEGELTINPSGRGLVESSVGINLNPAHAPFDGVGSDDDMNDTFGSGINGLIFSTRKLYFKDTNVIHGAIMSRNDVNIAGDFNLSFDSRYYRNPPPGFSGPEQIRVLLGSARRISE